MSTNRPTKESAARPGQPVLVELIAGEDSLEPDDRGLEPSVGTDRAASENGKD